MPSGLGKSSLHSHRSRGVREVLGSTPRVLWILGDHHHDDCIISFHGLVSTVIHHPWPSLGKYCPHGPWSWSPILKFHEYWFFALRNIKSPFRHMGAPRSPATCSLSSCHHRCVSWHYISQREEAVMTVSRASRSVWSTWSVSEEACYQPLCYLVFPYPFGVLEVFANYLGPLLMVEGRETRNLEPGLLIFPSHFLSFLYGSRKENSNLKILCTNILSLCLKKSIMILFFSEKPYFIWWNFKFL